MGALVPTIKCHQKDLVNLICFLHLAKITDTVSRWLRKYHETDLSILSKIEGCVLNDIKQNCNSFEELGHGAFLKFICADKNLLELVQSTIVGQPTSSNIPRKQELQDFARQCGDVSEKVFLLRNVLY